MPFKLLRLLEQLQYCFICISFENKSKKQFSSASQIDISVSVDGGVYIPYAGLTDARTLTASSNPTPCWSS